MSWTSCTNHLWRPAKSLLQSIGSCCSRKRRAGLPVSPVTRAEANVDASVRESGPVRSDESDTVKADESADEDMVPVLPSKAEVEAHNVSHLPFRSWCSACVRARGLSLGHHKVGTKMNEAEQMPTTGSLSSLRIEHTTHSQCSSCEIARGEVSGVIQYRRREWCIHILLEP